MDMSIHKLMKLFFFLNKGKWKSEKKQGIGKNK